MKTVYLAHPYAQKDEVQKNFQPLLEAIGLSVINPFIRPEQAYFETKMTAAGGANRGLDYSDWANIVSMDLAKIDKSDGIVASLTADNMIGTLMEIFYCAHVTRKPVFAYAPREREWTSPWIRYHAFAFQDQQGLLTALKEWMGDRVDSAPVESVAR